MSEQTPEQAIQRAQSAVDEAKATHGDSDVRVSYKLDELAAVLKGNGRLLDAANASAKARAIRTASVAKESDEQAEKFGDVTDQSERVSASEWLEKFRRWAIVAVAAGFIVALFVPASGMAASIAKNLVGTALFGAFLQLLMQPSVSQSASRALHTVRARVTHVALPEGLEQMLLLGLRNTHS